MKLLPIEHAIDLSDDIPVSHQPKRLAHGLCDPIKNVVATLLEKDFIVRSTSAYGSPIVLIIKKSGEVRLAIDYRKLNKKPSNGVFIFHTFMILLRKCEVPQFLGLLT